MATTEQMATTRVRHYNDTKMLYVVPHDRIIVVAHPCGRHLVKNGTHVIRASAVSSRR
ncbi:MAG TPA: hypothetical protein VNG51_04705 [Ktedonobacteraceae bacterium]|nr:hypothetical protein [Ktedonobacteraceae bacterium]